MSRSYQGVVDTYEDIPLAKDKVKHAKVELSTNDNKKINEIFDDRMNFYDDDEDELYIRNILGLSILNQPCLHRSLYRKSSKCQC